MTTPDNILELAKQGDPKAIAVLINRQLQPKGIKARVNLKDSCLQIMLESDQVPDQQTLVAFIHKGITSLGVNSIEKVIIYGKKTGDEFPAWSQDFKLSIQSNPIPNPNLSYQINGHNGQIRLTHNKIIISRKGVRGFVTQGLKGDKEIPIKSITGIQFRRASINWFTRLNGFIQFSMLGYSESKGGLFAAIEDENTVVFTKDQQQEFEEIKKYIDSVMDDVPIDFTRLKLLDTPTAEQRRIQNQKQATSQTINSILKSLGWVFGVIYLLGGAGYILQFKIISGLACLIISAISITPLYKIIENKFNLNLSILQKTLIVIIAFFLVGYFQ